MCAIENSDESPQRQYSRRGAMKSMAALAVGGGIALTAASLGKFLSGESEEALEATDHAFDKYNEHGKGILKENWRVFEEHVGKMDRAGFDKLASDEVVKNIFSERNALLRAADPTLIPQLLVAYVQSGIKEKSLVKVYKQLGGNVESVREKGLKGIDISITSQIQSVLEYYIAPKAIGYAAARGSLSFISKNAE